MFPFLPEQVPALVPVLEVTDGPGQAVRPCRLPCSFGSAASGKKGGGQAERGRETGPQTSTDQQRPLDPCMPTSVLMGPVCLAQGPGWVSECQLAPNLENCETLRFQDTGLVKNFL